MIYSYVYSTQYDPAMPVVEIGIGKKKGSIEFTLSALIDSGADATMIPEQYIQELGVSSREKRWMTGVTGGRYSVGLYTLYLEIGAFGTYIPVVGDSINSEVIVGRDILNRMVVTLDGIAETVEISA